MMAMFRIFAPSAVSPPSAKSSACTASTTVITSVPTHGPTRIAASAPPSRCPDVPAATGKLIICAAKMNTSSQAGQRRSAIVEFRARLAHGYRDDHPGHQVRQQAHGDVDEAIRDVHGDGVHIGQLNPYCEQFAIRTRLTVPAVPICAPLTPNLPFVHERPT